MDRISIDYSNVLASAVGHAHGLDEAELEALAQPSRAALAAVLARRERDLRWLDLPFPSPVHAQILDYAASVAGQFRNIVVLGIGGSALGNIALQTALNSPYHNLISPGGLPRLFVLDNVDPDLIGEFLDSIDPSECLFNVISKSGATPETMAQFLIFRRQLVDRLGEEAHKAHIVITTDAGSGPLREIVRREGYASFPVPEGVGGRYSVLSPVGLLPAALVGIDVMGLVAGAAAMVEACSRFELASNPALLYAAVQWSMQTRKHKPIAVTFAYSHRLRDLADWYAQLLAESIGKRVDRAGREVFAGPTPVRAVGVTDQHSQVQLYVEGPHDKWFTLLTVGQADHVVELPAAHEDLEGVGYLCGRTLNDLFHAECEGTRIALTEAARPNLTIQFPTVTPHTVGQYLYLMELAVAVMGEHYQVDAFDQPGVEAGKVAAFALMGRAGYESRRENIEKTRSREPRRV